ncbi:MAG: helix-turn-helix domain-containing protein [Gammaproteobacteria bacterium]|nr:helix-turn-helix domain-containing protein [Gammaproteobacteria bacterium]
MSANGKTESNVLNPIQLSKQWVRCDNCGLFGICNELGLNSDMKLFDRLITRCSHVLKETRLFDVDDEFNYLYVVKSGFIATFSSDDHATGRMTGLYFPGDLVGLDAIERGAYNSYAIALEESSVCMMDYSQVHLLEDRKTGFYHQLVSAMSNRIMHERWFSTFISARSTEERLASFLIYISSRLYVRGLPHIEFRLPITRRDIAEYLGLAVETVSRGFRRFQDNGVLTTSGRKIRIDNLDKLMLSAALEPGFFDFLETDKSAS